MRKSLIKSKRFLFCLITYLIGLALLIIFLRNTLWVFIPCLVSLTILVLVFLFKEKLLKRIKKYGDMAEGKTPVQNEKQDNDEKEASA